MKVIGVTGGVGAGKSEVLGYIAEHWNATVVEADEVGYLVMRPGKACYSAIVDLFGTEIVKEDQTLDRELIAKIVFENKEMLAKMNGIVHPAVKEYIKKAIKREEENETNIFIVEAALLIEDKYDEICGIPFRPAIIMIVLYPVHLQVIPMMTTALAPHTVFSQSTPPRPKVLRIWFTRPKSVLNSSLKIIAYATKAVTDGKNTLTR